MKIMKLETTAWLKKYPLGFPRLLVCGAVALAAVVAYPVAAVAQEKQSKEQIAQSKEQAELVDGLLDLLGEPEVDAAGAVSGAKPQDESQKATGQPASEVPHAGDDGSAAAANLPSGTSLSSHPLSIVQHTMRLAAERLGKGAVGPDTQKLQGDILQQLDGLIKDLQRQDPTQSSPQPKQQASTSQNQSSPLTTEEQASSAQQPPSDSSQSEQERQSTGQGAQDRLSQAGDAANVAVDLADPERLQQDLWGQLPEQMRKQMQSRMVESFLPSYRPQIEAYFRKLLESERR